MNQNTPQDAQKHPASAQTTTAASIRMPRHLLDRLQAAARRHRLPIAEIVRRACRRYLTACRNGVVILPPRNPTTRTDSEAIRYDGIPDGITPAEIPQIVAWYLAGHDSARYIAIDNPPPPGITITGPDGLPVFVFAPGADWRSADEPYR